jgi:hypothetical protein
MAYFDSIDINLFSLGDLGTFSNRDISQAITSLSISLTMSGSSEVSADILDPDFAMAKGNYFQIRRDAFYKGMLFEIAAVETSRSEGIHPKHQIQCRSKAIQLMKRDKRPEAFNGISGYDLAKRMALRYNMNFVGQKDAKKQATVKSNSGTTDDSVWSVLQSAAGEQEFVCFESENTLFYASEKWLLGKWGDEKFVYGDLKFIPFIWPEPTVNFLPEAIDKYVLLDMPTVRRSDDDVRAASGSMTVDRANGVNLRPGMTIFLGGMHGFDGFYLITDVQFAEGSFEPVGVQFRTPVDPNKENISTDGTKADTTTTSGGDDTNPFGGPDTEEEDKFATDFSKLKASDSKKYVKDFLSSTRYLGSNGNLIEEAVMKAAKALSEGIIKPIGVGGVIKTYSTKMSADEKTLAESIFWGFVFGIPVKTYAVAGGLSADAYDRIKQQAIDSTTSSETNVTPALGATDSSGSASTTLLPGPPQNYPTQVDTYIDTYISGLWQITTATEKTRLKTKAKQLAKNIYTLSTKTSKINKYNEIKKTYSSGFDKYIFNALRQEAVVKLLIPKFDDQKYFHLNYPGLEKAY